MLYLFMLKAMVAHHNFKSRFECGQKQASFTHPSVSEQKEHKGNLLGAQNYV